MVTPRSPRTVIDSRRMNGSLTLRDHPTDMVRLSCDRCGRAGQYRKEKLIVQFGPEIALPDLRHEIAM
jgi:hypothetical protein